MDVDPYRIRHIVLSPCNMLKGNNSLSSFDCGLSNTASFLVQLLAALLVSTLSLLSGVGWVPDRTVCGRRFFSFSSGSLGFIFHF